MTLNQLTDLIKDMGEKHAMIAKTHFGSVMAMLGSENKYPAFNFDFVGADIRGSELRVRFAFFFFDRVLQEEDNETEVISDQMLICQDIIAQLRYPGHDFSVDDFIPITFFSDDTPDVLAGVKADVTINLGYISDRCAVPSTLTYG